MSASTRTLRGTPGTGGGASGTSGTSGGDGGSTTVIGVRGPGAASALYDLVATDGRASGSVARLALGLVMFPHAAQKVFGWFGGYGLSATYGFFTTKMGLPGVIAASVIVLEALGSILLVCGAFSRVAAAGILAIMIGAVITTHADHGFFMNWNGTQLGEGFEFHLLAIALCIMTIIVGGGALSVDRLLTKRLRPEVDPISGKFMGGDGEPISGPASGSLAR